jgi:hypothetical protein
MEEKLSLYQIKRRYYDMKKLERGCEMIKEDGTVCGYREHPSALQLDHIDPDTKYRSKSGKLVNPSNLISRSQATIDREFGLCRVLCANCHAIHTHTVQRTPVLSVGTAKIVDIKTKRKVA